MYKKNNCSEKLQDGTFDHSPRKMSVEDFTFGKCLNFLI